MDTTFTKFYFTNVDVDGFSEKTLKIYCLGFETLKWKIKKERYIANMYICKSTETSKKKKEKDMQSHIKIIRPPMEGKDLQYNLILFVKYQVVCRNIMYWAILWMHVLLIPWVIARPTATLSLLSIMTREKKTIVRGTHAYWWLWLYDWDKSH